VSRRQWLGSAMMDALDPARLSAAVGRPPAVRLLHAGPTAAHARAGAAHAVITLSTTFGAGFPPGAQGLRPVAAPLVIT
jgi:hypothetical protein